MDECNCEFDPYPMGDVDYGQPSWHFKRICGGCGRPWFGLHCPHDGIQNPCPSCGVVPKPVEDHPDYREDSCEACGRLRVEWDGICEKCGFHADRHEYVTRISPLHDPSSRWSDHS